MARFRFFVTVAVVTASGLGSACTRTPPEPSYTGASTGTPRGDSGRCILATPVAPPPAASAAPPGSCPKDPNPHQLSWVDVSVETPEGTVALKAELAVHDTPEIERGLMFRTEMAEDRGMLFDLGAPHREHSFWMRNTCIPLDMLFIDDDGLIVGILENVPVLNEKERTVGCPASWVLEMNAGWSRRHGVRAGQKMKLPRPS